MKDIEKPAARFMKSRETSRSSIQLNRPRAIMSYLCRNHGRRPFAGSYLKGRANFAVLRFIIEVKDATPKRSEHRRRRLHRLRQLIGNIFEHVVQHINLIEMAFISLKYCEINVSPQI